MSTQQGEEGPCAPRQECDRRLCPLRQEAAYHGVDVAFAVLLTTSRAIENPDGFIVSGCLSPRPSWR
jgi:hypothetical protein